MSDFSIEEECYYRWDAVDERTDFFIENFDEWLEQIPYEIHDTMILLLKRFDYFSQAHINKLLCEFYQKLSLKQDFIENSLIYTCISKNEPMGDSSIEYMYNFKFQNFISDKVVLDLASYKKQIGKEFDKVKAILILDDFCGTGGTLNSFVRRNLDILNGKKIYYSVIYIMEDALNVIQSIITEFRIDIEVIWIYKGTKVFEVEPFNATTKSEYAKYSKQLGIQENYIFGWKNTEALVSFYNNTPNNTLGIFWYDTEKYFSIFPRKSLLSPKKHKVSLERIKEQKKERKEQNYNMAQRNKKNEKIF